MYKILLIGLGGAAGALARYGVGTLLIPVMERTGFPWGTFVVNVAGCFLIGLLSGLFQQRWLLAQEYQTALLIGFLGGLTTFSSYAWETLGLTRDGEYLRAGANLLLNNVVCLAVVLVGYAWGSRV